VAQLPTAELWTCCGCNKLLCALQHIPQLLNCAAMSVVMVWSCDCSKLVSNLRLSCNTTRGHNQRQHALANSWPKADAKMCRERSTARYQCTSTQYAASGVTSIVLQEWFKHHQLPVWLSALCLTTWPCRLLPCCNDFADFGVRHQVQVGSTPSRTARGHQKLCVKLNY